MDVKKIAVIGSGIMGHGIAQVCATSGYDVVVTDLEDRFLHRGMEAIQTSLARVVKSAKMTNVDVAEVLSRIKTTTDLRTAVADADMVVEAAPEILDLKKYVFKAVDELTRPDAVLASNTSQFSITTIASATRNPQRVIGMHWFNPPVLMKLVEIIPALDTEQEIIKVIEDVSHKCGKETVICQDSPGFLVSRLVAAMFVEAYRMYAEGLAPIEDIDKAIKLGLNHPMGPFELSDFNGLDTVLHAVESQMDAFGERFRPPHILRKLTTAGHLGRKTGRGFYTY